MQALFLMRNSILILFHFATFSFPILTFATALNCATATEPLFKQLNPTAKVEFADYTSTVGEYSPRRPNDRPLRGNGSYNSTLRASLEDHLPIGGVVIGLGSGHGYALRELSELNHATAIVLNTQKPTQEILDYEKKAEGQFRYIKGWAEETLRLFKNFADLIVDVFGAYSYSIEKVSLIQDMYQALKIGGTARILIAQNSEAYVVDPVQRELWIKNGRRGATGLTSLHYWLTEKHPDIFSWIPIDPPKHYWDTGKVQSNFGVLVMKKNTNQSTLDLKLSYMEHFDVNSPLFPALAPDVLFVPREYPNQESLKLPRRPRD